MRRLVFSLLSIFCIFLMTCPVWGQVKIIASEPYVSALVINADTGEELFSDNADARIYPASVLKLMVLSVVLDRIEQGQLRLDQMVQVTNEAYRTGGSQVYLDPREQFSVDDLLYALMVQSANDAAVALAIHVAGSKDGFVELMNTKARELNMEQTHFASVHGLPPAKDQEVDVSTAKDLALLCRELVQRPEALRYTSTRVRDFREGKLVMRNHNHLLDQVVGCDGLKTGYFSAAGFSIAATAMRDGVRLIALVMGSRDRKVRDAKASELLASGFSRVKVHPPSSPEVAVAKEATEEPTPVEGTSVQDPRPTTVTADEGTVQSPGTGGWKMFIIGMVVGMALCWALMYWRTQREKQRTTNRYLRR